MTEFCLKTCLERDGGMALLPVAVHKLADDTVKLVLGVYAQYEMCVYVDDLQNLTAPDNLTDDLDMRGGKTVKEVAAALGISDAGLDEARKVMKEELEQATLYGLDDIPEGWFLYSLSRHTDMSGKLRYEAMLQNSAKDTYACEVTAQLAIHEAIKKAMGK